MIHLTRPRPRTLTAAVLIIVTTLASSGCWTGWTITTDRDASLYLPAEWDGIGYTARRSVAAHTPTVVRQASRRDSHAAVLVADRQIATVRASSAQGNEIRIEAADWVEATDLDLAVVQHPLHEGMAQPAVVEAWGEPHEIGEVVMPGVARETWTYHTTSQRECLFFENGRLVAWSSSLRLR